MLTPVLTVALALSQGICTTGSTRTCKIANCVAASQVCLSDRTWGPCVCSSCDDNNPCTTDSWSGTACVSMPVNIDDGNPCTIDSCTSRAGITHTPVPTGTSCSDGNACNGAEECNAYGSCQPGTPPTVDDGNPCTVDSCDVAIGPVHEPLTPGTLCSDGNYCNGLEFCDGAGMCVGGLPPVVDDGSPCTADRCDPLYGVFNDPLPIGASCSDGNVCNGSETCREGSVCTSGTPPAVDDLDPCTADRNLST